MERVGTSTTRFWTLKWWWLERSRTSTMGACTKSSPRLIGFRSISLKEPLSAPNSYWLMLPCWSIMIILKTLAVICHDIIFFIVDYIYICILLVDKIIWNINQYKGLKFIYSTPYKSWAVCSDKTSIRVWVWNITAHYSCGHLMYWLDYVKWRWLPIKQKECEQRLNRSSCTSRISSHAIQ